MLLKNIPTNNKSSVTKHLENFNEVIEADNYVTLHNTVS